MVVFINFVVAFVISFVGSIPPGSINLTVIQLGLAQKISAALRFSAAAALMEYPYGWIAVKFESLITSSPAITENLTLISAVVLLVLGIVSVIPAHNSGISYNEKFSSGGYRHGFLLGVLNPLAIPYWIGMTAYLKAQGWIELSSNVRVHSYLLGVVIGSFLLLVVLTYLSNKVMKSFSQFPWIRKVPGLVLIVLGVHAFIEYAVQ